MNFLCFITCICIFLFLRYISMSRKERDDWSVGGIPIGASRDEVILLKNGVCQEDGSLFFTRESNLAIVQFDKNDLVKSVRGFTLEGPNGYFKAGQYFQKLLEKMGEPNSIDNDSSQYFRQGIEINVIHSIEGPRRIEGFHICKLCGRSAVLAELRQSG